MTNTLKTLGVSTLSGIAGLMLMDAATTQILERTPEAVQRKEKAVQPESAMQVAARKSAQAVGVELSEAQAQSGASVLHYALGVLGGLLYLALRRTLPLGAFGSGIATGLGMFVVLDEGVNSLFGFAAPPAAFPKETHLRGLVGHLVFGLGVAAVAEVLRRIE